MATRAHGGRPGRDTNGGPPVRGKLDGHPARVAWLIAAGLIMAMVGIGCGGDDDDGGGGERAAERRQGRGQAEPARLGGLRRGRLDGPEGRLGDATSRSRPAARSASRSSTPRTRWSQLMRTGQYDGVSASGNAIGAPGGRRRRRPGQRRPGPELRDGLRGPQGPALQHLRRHPLRDPARTRGEPADVEHGRRQARPEVLGRHPRSRTRPPSTRARSASTTTRSTSPTRPCT